MLFQICVWAFWDICSQLIGFKEGKKINFSRAQAQHGKHEERLKEIKTLRFSLQLQLERKR